MPKTFCPLVETFVPLDGENPTCLNCTFYGEWYGQREPECVLNAFVALLVGLQPN